MSRRGLVLAVLAGVVAVGPAAYAQRCRKPYHPSRGFCCPANKDFDAKLGDCVGPSAPASATAPAASAPASASASASAEPPPAPRPRKITIHPRITSQSGAPITAKPTILVAGKPPTSDDTFEVAPGTSLVRVDVKVPGQEDVTSYVPVVPDVPLDATVRPYRNVSVKIVGDDGHALRPHGQVYVDCDKGEVHECTVGPASGECDLAISTSECTSVRVRVVGTVNTELDGVVITDDKVTSVALVVHAHKVPLAVLSVPIALTAIGLGAFIAGLAVSDSDVGQALLGVSAGVGALDFTLGVWLVGQFAAPSTTVTPFVDGHPWRDVSAALASNARPSRSALRVGVAPAGFVLRW